MKFVVFQKSFGSILFESFCSDSRHEWSISMLLYVSVSHHDDTVDIDTVEEMEVVGDEDDRLASGSPCVDLLAEYVDRIDIESWVDLIEHDNTGIE